METQLIQIHNLPMKKTRPHPKPQRPKYFFKEWRKYRGLTQEQLAERIGTSTPSISQLETGKQGFTDKTLEAFAQALNCTPADLLMRNPTDPEAPWSIWETLEPAQREQTLRFLNSFVTDNNRKAG